MTLVAIAAAHGIATAFLTGVIWYVQLVHYPLFARADAGSYREFQREHERRTSWIVGPAMLSEAAAALALAVTGWTVLPQSLLVGSIVLLVLVWSSTAGLQVPRHRRLAAGFDAVAHRELVSTNWIRTVGWSARLLVAVSLVVSAAGHA